jgi:hypothetical protein
MLTLKVATVEQVNSIIVPMMDQDLLHRHLHEGSIQEEISLTYVPYWIVSVSARTTVIAANETAQIAQTATTAALMGVTFGGMSSGFRVGRRLFDGGVGTGGLLTGPFGLGGMRIMAFGMGMGRMGGMKRTEHVDANYNFPVIALKALMDYQ